MSDRYRIEVLAESDTVTADDVLAMWAREGALPAAEAHRRVHEVLLVATDPAVVGVCTAYLQRNRQLRMDLWYVRVFVAGDHRLGKLASTLGYRTFDLLEHRYVTGQDRRGAGVAAETENPGLQAHYQRTGQDSGTPFVLIGENARGQIVGVHYFPGAPAPLPR